jgi:alpha(1,3/1,4) fucosyltransferase
MPGKIAFWNFHESLNGNHMFSEANTAFGDELLLPLVELYRSLSSQGFEVATCDLMAPAEADCIVFIDMPDRDHRFFREAVSSGKPLYLLVMESPIVRPQNFEPLNQGFFRRIFTYRDDFVDNLKYIKLNYSFRFPPGVSFGTKTKEKLCTMIASRKKPVSTGSFTELYRERLRAIRWFDRNHPDQFDLYGVGWRGTTDADERPATLGRMIKGLFKERFRTYRGKVERKRPILERYYFSICYENVMGVSGYITEKIFDSVIAGCVPVYLGAGNVQDWVPRECFIDKREFDGYPALYAYLSGMPAEQYESHLRSMERFLASEKASCFGIDQFVTTVSTVLQRDIGN